MLPLLSPPGLSRRPSLRTLGAHRVSRPELLTGVRAMDHASNESAPADAEPGEHVLALVAAHLGRRCRPVVRLLFREAPDSRHPTSFRADPTPLRSGYQVARRKCAVARLEHARHETMSTRYRDFPGAAEAPSSPSPPRASGARAAPEPAPAPAPKSVERGQKRFGGLQWARVDSNHRPTDYESAALTS